MRAVLLNFSKIVIKNIMKKLFFAFATVLFLASCDDGDSSSGGGEDSVDLDSFVGVYVGSLTATASAAGLSQVDTFDITVTVFDDNTVRFQGDDPDETFTTDLNDDGSFAEDLSIVIDECEGTVETEGIFDGDMVSGSVEGDGVCSDGELEVDIELEGTFSATRI